MFNANLLLHLLSTLTMTTIVRTGGSEYIRLLIFIVNENSD